MVHVVVTEHHNVVFLFQCSYLVNRLRMGFYVEKR